MRCEGPFSVAFLAEFTCGFIWSSQYPRDSVADYSGKWKVKAIESIGLSVFADGKLWNIPIP